jgi:hypothetical protein
MATDIDRPDLPKLPATGTPALDPDKPLKTTREVKTAEEYAALEPGFKYVDPEGKTRQKPHAVSDAASYAAVPEGETYVDPSGKKRQKPIFDGIDLTAQTLYDMAVNDKERRNVLVRSYGDDAVKQDEFGGFYVDAGDGRRLKPGHGNIAKRGAAFVASEAVPVAGAVAGAVGGGAVGSLVPGGGTIVGGIAGAGGGAAIGQGFNDIILGLTGVYDRSIGEEAGTLGTAAAGGAVGEGAGRLVVGGARLAKDLVVQGKAALPGRFNAFLGTDPDKLRLSSSLADKGVLTPPTWAEESPHLRNIVEVFDPAFRTQKPLVKSATAYYEDEAKKLLATQGMTHEGSVVEPSAAPSTLKAGEAVKAKIASEVAEKDAALRNALDRAKLTASQGGAANVAEHEANLAALKTAEAENRKTAQAAIDAGFTDIKADVDAAMKATKAGQGGGDLWEMVGNKLMSIRRAIGVNATRMYDRADEMAGTHLPNTGDLVEYAQTFLDQLPKTFQDKYPNIVKKLRDLAGEVDAEGKVIRPPENPTFGQLRRLRTDFRSNVDYHDLTPDVRDGVYKHFAGKVDGVLHDAGAVPELKAAAEMLDEADAYYKENIRAFKDKNIQAVVNGLESGMPADANILYNTVVKEGRTELTNKVRDLVGPNLWAGVKAADVQEMLDAAKTLIPGEIDGRTFSRQVLDRTRSGMLESVHGKETADKLLRQAQNIEMLGGRLPVTVRPGDTLTTVIQRANEAADAIKLVAKQDPLGTFAREMKAIDHEGKIAKGKLAAERRADPLAFLYKPTTGADEAANHILGSEDLIIAAAKKFGENSNEFKLLRQLWTQRILEGTLDPGRRLASVSPEIQQMMMPGVSLDAMQTLAKEMDFLMGTRAGANTAKSIAAVAKVEHPWSSITGKFVGQVAKAVPGSDVAGRAILGGYYKVITNLQANPAFQRWLITGLNGTGPQRDAAREAFRKLMSDVGGVTGAGIGASVGSGGSSQEPHRPRPRQTTGTRKIASQPSPAPPPLIGPPTAASQLGINEGSPF